MDHDERHRYERDYAFKRGLESAYAPSATPVPLPAWDWNYDTLTAETLQAALPIGCGSAPLRYVDGSGYCEVSREPDGAFTVRTVLVDDGYVYHDRSETFDCAHGAYGALSALGQWVTP